LAGGVRVKGSPLKHECCSFHDSTTPAEATAARGWRKPAKGRHSSEKLGDTQCMRGGPTERSERCDSRVTRRSRYLACEGLTDVVVCKPFRLWSAGIARRYKVPSGTGRDAGTNFEIEDVERRRSAGLAGRHSRELTGASGQADRGNSCLGIWKR